jgi:glutamate carboxypeptidase
VSDDKAGIALIVELIRTFQKSKFYPNIEFKVFIAGDEEITSVHSKASMITFAKGSDLALVFEPGWWDEEHQIPRIPSAVGGNALIEWTVKGIEAHSGIAYEKGRSAVLALAKHIQHFESWSNVKNNFLVNVATIEGGGKLNVRPGSAQMKVSVRYEKIEDEARLMTLIQEAQKLYQTDGIVVDYRLEFRWHPQKLASEKLIADLQHAAKSIDQLEPQPSLSIARSASAILSEEGFDSLDAMGPYGTGFHSDKEEVQISSAYERLNLICQFLLERIGKATTIKR